MIDTEKMARISAGTAFETPKSRAEADLDLLDVGELLRLRGEIDRRLPATTLNDMNLEEELVRQYLRVQAMQDTVMEDDDTPANQKAQVAAQVASTLQHLVKMQTDFHTAERLKEIESRLIRALEKVAPEHLTEFFAWYESGDIQ